MGSLTDEPVEALDNDNNPLKLPFLGRSFIICVHSDMPTALANVKVWVKPLASLELQYLCPYIQGPPDNWWVLQTTELRLIDNFEATKAKGQSLFKEPTVFIEKYIVHAKHVEVQIFVNGEGHVVHMGEREWSVQRRHQKVIEEALCVMFESDMGKGKAHIS